MENILIRSGISPLDSFDASYMIDNNSIGSNVGNLIYAYSVYRTLLTEGTNIVPDYYSTNPNNAEAINEKYDCYIIPLADAFRPSFIPLLRRYTKLIKKLKIPVIVIGVGLSAPFEPKLNEGFPFDNDVKEFVSAVLEKSSIIGVRGQITADYLSRLGFREGTDHTVIGCPSMYAFGRELNIRETDITKDSLVCVNSSMKSPASVLDFISRSMKAYPNHYFIPQWRSEMILTYAGSPSISEKDVNYPTKMSDPVYMNDRVRYFLNAPTWIDFISKADLSFGARLHGNVTATIAGTPSLIIPKDGRMRELAEYHSLTSIWWNDIKADTKLEEIIAISDFKSPERVQARNFDNFINFLNKNNLQHVYKEGNYPTEVTLDKRIKEVELKSPIGPVSGITTEEMVERWEKYYPLAEKREAKRNKQLTDKHKKELTSKNKKIKHLENTLNRKSVRIALSTANKFRLKK